MSTQSGRARRPNRTRQQPGPQNPEPTKQSAQPVRTKSDPEKAMELAQAHFQARTNTATVAYDNAVEEAMLTRDKATELLHQRTLQETVEIDNQYNNSVTAAWKAMMSNKDSARQERDTELDSLRHAMTPTLPAVTITDENGGGTRQYDLVSPGSDNGTPEAEIMDPEEPVLCLRCNTMNPLGQWTADGNIRCPNCGAMGTLEQAQMQEADSVHIADATEVIDPLPSSRGE
jgi:hypothetical protein